MTEKSRWQTRCLPSRPRGEGFNVFNRVRFGVGNTNMTNPNFGLVTGTSNGPRRFQLGEKLTKLVPAPAR